MSDMTWTQWLNALANVSDSFWNSLGRILVPPICIIVLVCAAIWLINQHVKDNH